MTIAAVAIIGATPAVTARNVGNSAASHHVINWKSR